jgi:hypothetical protein
MQGMLGMGRLECRALKGKRRRALFAAVAWLFARSLQLSQKKGIPATFAIASRLACAQFRRA